MPTALMLGSNTDITSYWNTLLSALRATTENYHYKKTAACRDTEETHRKVGYEKEICVNKSQWKHTGLH